MAFKQPNNPFSQRSYQKAQTKRFGHQKESKFQYDIRMRKEANRRAKSEYTTQEKKLHEQMSRDLAEQDDPMWNEPGYIQGKHGDLAPNPNDLTDKSKVQNFGIIPGMSFGEAFKQAGKTAKKGDIFMWNDQPFIYEFENDLYERDPHQWLANQTRKK